MPSISRVTTEATTRQAHGTETGRRQRIVPFLWFDGQAEEAARFYTSLFDNSRILNITHWGDAGPGPKGTVMTVAFELDGLECMALNGGPEFRFTEAFSFMVKCDTQAEIDELWAKLSAGGAPGRCGWLKDKFGLSWQVGPREMGEMLQDGEPQRAQRVIAALMQMDKLDIGRLRAAYEGR